VTFVVKTLSKWRTERKHLVPVFSQHYKRNILTNSGNYEKLTLIP